MGMFDDIRCEMPIPVQWRPLHSWQTKSLGCEMDKYVIRADGLLIREPGGWGHGDVPEMVIPYHGDIKFHDYDKELGWLALIARFTEGRCVRIWQEEWRAPHNAPDTPPPPPASATEAASADETGTGSAEGEGAAPQSGETPHPKAAGIKVVEVGSLPSPPSDEERG